MVVMYNTDRSAPAKAHAEGVLTGSLNLWQESDNTDVYVLTISRLHQLVLEPLHLFD